MSGSIGPDPAERTVKIAREQRSVDDARRFAELACSYSDAACREAVAMAVSEFAENVVKYSAADRTPGAGTIAIRLYDGGVRIRVTNVPRSQEDAQRLVETITKIGSSTNIRELYRLRLRELFDNPQLPRAQLGLLRVAFEGGFRLTCSYTPPMLEITAERSCGSGR